MLRLLTSGFVFCEGFRMPAHHKWSQALPGRRPKTCKGRSRGLHFTSTKAAAVAETEHHASLETVGNRQQRFASSALITSGIFCGARR